MIITLCGSSRFEAHYNAWNEALTLNGHVVFSLAVMPSLKASREWYSEEQKAALDLAHLAKIQVSDAILVLNVDGYVGESTKREIAWARIRGKEIWALESWGEGCSPAAKRGEPSMITSRGFATHPYSLAPLMGEQDPRTLLKGSR